MRKHISKGASYCKICLCILAAVSFTFCLCSCGDQAEKQVKAYSGKDIQELIEYQLPEGYEAFPSGYEPYGKNLKIDIVPKGANDASEGFCVSLLAYKGKPAGSGRQGTLKDYIGDADNSKTIDIDGEAGYIVPEYHDNSDIPVPAIYVQHEDYVFGLDYYKDDPSEKEIRRMYDFAESMSFTKYDGPRE